jgi:hypothetical protein
MLAVATGKPACIKWTLGLAPIRKLGVTCGTNYGRLESETNLKNWKRRGFLMTPRVGMTDTVGRSDRPQSIDHRLLTFILTID